jgi:tetratricopeptide (TPR) repeat protein
MVHKGFPTQDSEAFSNFVRGRVLFQGYLESGNGEQLNQAKDRFAEATVRDPNFDIAKLYLAVTETELRDSDAAIPALRELVDKRSYLPEAHVQLAYAHIKKYRDEGYPVAQEELDKAEHDATTENREYLIELITSYRVFLLAVRGGRQTDLSREQRRNYLNQALELGEKVLRQTAAAEQDCRPAERSAQFEANNALGVALMWLGQWFPTEPSFSESWMRSEYYFRAALTLRPKSVRTLQNLGLLYTLRGDREPRASAKEALYKQAIDFVTQSVELNPYDQYPHYQLAALLIKVGDWDQAQKSFERGIVQKGAVSQETWAKVREAIDTRDASKIARGAKP